MVVSKEHHHPILCQALPGGQNDSLSVASTLDMLKGQGLRHLTLIMDKGMTSKENVRKAIAAGYTIVGSVRGWNKETIPYASKWQGDELEQDEYIVGTSHGNAVYARSFTSPLMGFPKMRIAVVENIFRKGEDCKARDLLLKELNGPVSSDRLREIRKELGEVIVNAKGRRGFIVEEDAVKRERALDGRFLLFSTDISLTGDEMYKTYFAKDAVEKVFRTSKGELSLGPVRYRRKDRVDAYATVVYMAYLLWSWAERRLQKKYPGMRLSEALRIVDSVSWVRFGTGKSVQEWTTRLTTKQEEILSAVGAMKYLPAT
jgi:transposase